VTVCLVHPQESGIHPGHTFTILPHMDGQESKSVHPIYWFRAPHTSAHADSDSAGTSNPFSEAPLHARADLAPHAAADADHTACVPSVSSAESHLTEL
jgi:hypothetical protein